MIVMRFIIMFNHYPRGMYFALLQLVLLWWGNLLALAAASAAAGVKY